MPNRSRVPEPAEVERPSDDPEERNPLKAYVDVFAEDWATLPLAGKLAKIMGAIGTIPKSGYNSVQHYKFSQETDLVGAIRPYLAAAGVLLTFSVVEHEIIPRDGKSMLTHVKLHYVLTDGTGTIDGFMDGYGMDAGDKGVYKAITGAKKYTLMTLFLIDTGDDPEADTKTDVETQRASRPVRDQAPRPLLAPTHPPFAPEPDFDSPVIGPLNRTDVVRGGHSSEASDVQRNRLVESVRGMNWTARQFLFFIRSELGVPLMDAPEDDPVRLRPYINDLLTYMKPEDMGRLLMAVEHAADIEAEARSTGGY